jgi:hypothetical protein
MNLRDQKNIQVYGLFLRSDAATQVPALDNIGDLARDVLVVCNALQNFAHCRGDDFGAGRRRIARDEICHPFRNSSKRNKT